MNLLDLINQNRARRFAGGGFVQPYAAKLAQAQDTTDRSAQVQGGAFSTVPPPLGSLDESTAGQVTPGAVTPASQEVNEFGSAPRNLEAGVHDFAGGLNNAMAATMAALGGDALAGKLHAAAQEHAARAEALTTDQPKSWHNDVHGVGDALQFGVGQAIRGLPTLGAMAVGGGLARGLGAPALAGVAVPSMALNTGSAYGEMADQPGVDQQAAGRKALQAGAVNAGIDSLAFGYASKLAPFAKGALAKTLSSSLPGHVLRSALAEGATGAARQYVNDVAVKQLLGNPDAYGLTEEDIHGLTDAAAQNVAATLPLSVPGHFAHGISTGIDKTIDLAGNVLKRVPGMADEAARGAGSLAGQAQDAAQPAVEGALGKAQDFAARAAAHPLVGKVVNLAGAGVEAAKKAGAGLADQASAVGAGLDSATAALHRYATSKPEVRDAMNGLTEALKPEEEPGVQKSLATPLTPEQRTLATSLRNDHKALSINDGIALAKIFEPLSLDGKKFDEALARPGVADHIAALTGLEPAAFKDYVNGELGRRTVDDGRTTPDRMAEHNVMDAEEKAVPGHAAEEGEALHDINTSDVLNAVDHPNQTGADNPHMDAEAFGKMLLTEDQKAKKHKGNAWVNVTRTTKDAATGEVTGTTTEPKQINFTNVATAWRDRTLAQGGRTAQHSMDDNFKQGLSSMLSGWHEVDEHGNPVDVTVQPARQHTENGEVTAVDRPDMAGWLRPDSVVGSNGKLRTFDKVEQSGRANQPVDVHSAVADYYSAKDTPQDKAGAADKIAAAVADKVRDRLNDYKPEDRQRTMDRTHNYLMNPMAYDGDTRAAIKAGVLPEVATLPHDVLHAAKSGLLSRLSDLDMQVVQPSLKGEQATSVDQDMGGHSETRDAEGQVKEDLSGQHINYKEDERAALAPKPAPISEGAPATEHPYGESGKDDLSQLKQNYARATTVPGKAIARKALEAATKKAKPAK